MKNEIDVIEKYLKMKQNDTRCNCFGHYEIAPMILMINDELKIVKELLEDNDFNNKSNLLSFLENGVVNIRRELTKKDAKYEQYNDYYSDIKWVLRTFNSMPNKWSINSETFLKELLENV